MNYRLQRQKSGVQAVHNAAFGETMHPGAGPWAEANALYVQGSALAAGLCDGRPGPVVVFDVGLGGAANALAAITCRDALQRRGGAPRPLHLVSFEADPEAAAFALESADALGYLRGHEALLGELLRQGEAERPGLRWELRVGDFPQLIAEEPLRADVMFFDPFSPRANPAMWSLTTLEALFRCRRHAGGTRLLTYSTAFGARAGLLLAGFFVGETPRGTGANVGRSAGETSVRGGTQAATEFARLERPLTPAWLARWRHDREPWPPQTPPAQHRSLRERLTEHPQWEQASDADEGGADPAPRAIRPGRRLEGLHRPQGPEGSQAQGAPRRPSAAPGARGARAPQRRKRRLPSPK